MHSWTVRLTKMCLHETQSNTRTGIHLSDAFTAYSSWLRHCATSRKVAGSISGGVIRNIHWINPSGCTMVLGSTQPLTEMSTRYISWGGGGGKGGRCVRLTTLPTLSKFWKPQPPRTCPGLFRDNFTFPKYGIRKVQQNHVKCNPPHNMPRRDSREAQVSLPPFGTSAPFPDHLTPRKRPRYPF